MNEAKVSDLKRRYEAGAYHVTGDQAADGIIKKATERKQENLRRVRGNLLFLVGYLTLATAGLFSSDPAINEGSHDALSLAFVISLLVVSVFVRDKIRR